MPPRIPSSFLGGTAFFSGCDGGVLLGLGLLLALAAITAAADALIRRRRRRVERQQRHNKALADAAGHLRELDRLLGVASACSARDERPRGGSSPLPAPRASIVVTREDLQR